MFGEFRVARVEVIGRGLGFRVRIGCLLSAIEGRERGFDAELAFATAAFCGGFLWGGEREEAEEDGGGLSDSGVPVRFGNGFGELREECGFGKGHGVWAREEDTAG